MAWVSDSMHCNTFEASNGYNTRRFDDLHDEVQVFQPIDPTSVG